MFVVYLHVCSLINSGTNACVIDWYIYMCVHSLIVVQMHVWLILDFLYGYSVIVRTRYIASIDQCEYKSKHQRIPVVYKTTSKVKVGSLRMALHTLCHYLLTTLLL